MTRRRNDQAWWRHQERGGAHVSSNRRGGATAVRPFQVNVPEEELAELRRRIAAVRWPSRELVTDRSQGVQLATMQQLARYWARDYDLRRIEARLNDLPQFTTTIDGVDIHFPHLGGPDRPAVRDG